MLSLKFIRENQKLVENSLSYKKCNVDIDELISLDEDYRKSLKEVENLRADKNKVSNKISEYKKLGKSTKEYIEKMRIVSKDIKNVETSLNELSNKINNKKFFIPNIINSSVPIGVDSTENIVVDEWGEKPEFKFAPKNHLEIGEELQLFDFKRSAKMAGSGFPLFKGAGARLERSLINFMLDHHTTSNNYVELLPPYLSNPLAMQNTGQLPKFEDDMYKIPNDKLYCIPTAEVPVTNMHQDEILPESDLPRKYVAYSACFRREAGSYGRDTKGLSRLHQFNKVELVKFVHPRSSYEALETLLKDATLILQKLGLHYRVIELCSGDLSFSAAKCYDIEVWSPSENKYLEVSSCSNFEDFQARRGNIRYRDNQTGKINFVHTLNGSGLATPRLMISLLESYQNKDGSIDIPDILNSYMKSKRIDKA